MIEKINFSESMLESFGYKIDRDPFSLTREDIISIVTNHYNIDFNELATSSRLRYLVIPRQDLMYLLRVNTHMTFKEIGYLFNRDHATVMHAIKQVEIDASFDFERREFLNQYLPHGSMLTKHNFC